MPSRGLTDQHTPSPHEGLFHCPCGAIVAKDREGHPVTPVLGARHECPQPPTHEEPTYGHE